MDPPQKGPEVRQMLPYHNAVMKMNLIQSQKPQTSNIDHGLIWSRLQFMWPHILFCVSLSVSSQSPLDGYCPKDEQRKQKGHWVPCPKGQESSRPWHCLRSTSKRSVTKNWTSYNQTLHCLMMTSSNGNIFRVTGVTGEFPSQRPATQSFDAFFYLFLNKRLSKQSWGWWFETPSC